MKVFIVDQHAIYRRGLMACLEGLEEIERLDGADTIAEARSQSAFLESDVVLIDAELEGCYEAIKDMRGTAGPNVLVCSSHGDQREVLAAVQAGAVGYLSKEALTPDALLASLRAAADGYGVLAPEFLGDLLRTVARATSELLEPRGLTLSPLTRREQQVLRLVADGHPTREVARQLSYSERTVKNVIHDVATKFNARSRSQAVAAAVREGLI